jgi:tetraacyldisaccharide 4'-kinase
MLWPLVPLYRAGLGLREFGLRSGLERARRLKWPVVSVGNLSTGGAGKTPLVIVLANALKARGVNVDVLSRGYGRRSARPLLVDNGGSAEQFGDEPLEIACAAEVPVYVAAQRYAAGLLAEAQRERESRPSDKNKDVARAGHPASQRMRVHLLDDGFQHRQLHRDVDILLLSGGDLKDHLLPAGNLREGLHAAARADVIAIPSSESELEAEIKSRGWRAAIWRVRRRMDVPKIDEPVAAFCGIAKPEQFFEGLLAAGARLAAWMAFGDHHRYSVGDVKRIAAEARRAGATAILTTEKDRVRMGTLAATLPVQTVKLLIEIEDEKTAIEWLLSKLKDCA